eukprot:1038888_1
MINGLKMPEQNTDYQHLLSPLKIGEETFQYFDILKLNDTRLASLPYCIKVLLECAVRNCDGFVVTDSHVECILDWTTSSGKKCEVPFKPARVLLQDFTGVPSVVDLAAMRAAVSRLGGDPCMINPAVPVDLVVDHSVQVDVFGVPESAKINAQKEIERNRERFEFLKWGSKAFKNFLIVPPGSGIVHQINLEYLAHVVFNKDGLLYPDSLVGTDSHTTMINGLGVAGWGVGGLEAESVMLDQSITMVLPEVIGFRLFGEMQSHVTATDLVLTVTKKLRAFGVVGKFVEFFGPGMIHLSLADRATIANMCPEYGATMGYFPVDGRTVEYLRQTGRSEGVWRRVEAYMRAQGMFVDYSDKDGGETSEPTYTDVIQFDLATVVPSVSGPKRPHDLIPVGNLKDKFEDSLTHPVGFHGFGLSSDQAQATVNLTLGDQTYALSHGSVVLAAITSCTNTSNPDVMVAAGLLCKKAVEKGLKVAPYIKTSLAPGSHVVTEYLSRANLASFMDQLGFVTVGYGCTSCIGNSGDLVPEVSKAIADGDLVASAVLSGNRNFEGRVHSEVRACFLASPPLVVAYALAGTVRIDFKSDPLGQDQAGKLVYLRDIWPLSDEIQRVVSESVLQSMFKDVYGSITDGTEQWNELVAPEGTLYPWSDQSTYIHHPPFFQTMSLDPPGVRSVEQAHVLLYLGDSITTDHISPAGKIARNSPAARYLEDRGVSPADFNTYGARRGNDEVMARGTFANIRLVNKFVERAGPNTMHIPSRDTLPVWDAAERYMAEGRALIIVAGAQYGSGSSRDWAAKGPHLQGVSGVIATSYERIHRSNLVGMGIVPMQFKEGQSLETLGLSGEELYTIDLVSKPLTVQMNVDVCTSTGVTFQVILRLETDVEIEYIKHGGILHFVIRKMMNDDATMKH